MAKNLLFELPGGNKLRADAAASYVRMRAAGMPAGGVAVFHRSMKKQAELYRRHKLGIGPLAARPSPTAPHVRGVAIDLQTTSAGRYDPSDAHLWLTDGGDGGSRPKAGEKLQAHAFGWRRTVPSERWHFGYDPGRDRRRAADLKGRLEQLGFSDVAKFQAAHGLAPDGNDGPLTWKALLMLTGAGATTSVAPLKFRFGHATFAVSGEAVDDAIHGRFLMDQLACSVYALTGVPERRRTAIRIAMGGEDSWLVYPLGDATVLWSAAKWLNHDRAEVAFGSSGSGGAVRARLSARSTGRPLDVIALQARRADEFPSVDEAAQAQQADLEQALTKLHRTKVPTVVAGDLGSAQATAILTKRGFKKISGPVPDGGNAARQVWMSSKIALRLASAMGDPAAMDPSWQLKLTLPKVAS